MKFNRLLSLILCLILVIASVSALSFAEETEAVYGKESIGILSALDIAEISDSELVDNITRADFMKMMAVLAGYGEVKSANAVFNDMAADDEREGYLRALYNLGIIAPDKNGNINPDTEISMAEAAAVAVKVTGFGLVADSRGGYPQGYMSVAKMNGLLKGLPSVMQMPVTKGMAAKLADNTLKADMMLQTGFGNDTSYEEKKGTSLLYSVFGVMYVEDVLTGVDISRLMGENDVETFFIEIAGLEIQSKSVKNIYDYLGYRVKAYYTEERGDIPKLLYIEKTEKNTEKVIDVDDINSISDGKIDVYDEASGSDKNYSYTKGVPVVYNGVATKQNFSEALIDGKAGKIRLVDNSGDNVADVVFADIYETYVVAQVDTTENIVYDKYKEEDGSIRSIVLDTMIDDPYTAIFNAEGEEVKLNKIKGGNIIAVFKSAPDAYQGYINVYIVSGNVTGVIERIKDGGKKLVIAGVEYDVTDKARAKFGGILKAGSIVNVKLDYDGKVIWVEKAEQGIFQYGYIAATDMGEGIGTNAKFKIYTLNNQFEIFDAAQNLLIDGQKLSGDDANILTVLNEASAKMFNVYDESGTLKKGVDSSCTASMVRYMLNSAGEISAIDTVLHRNADGSKNWAIREDLINNPNDVMFTSKIENGRYHRSFNVIGSKNAFDAAALAFFYPNPAKTVGSEVDDSDDLMDEENYKVNVAKNILVYTEVQYNGHSFFADNSEYITNFMAFPTSNSSVNAVVEENKLAVVDDVFDVYDEKNDRVVKCVKILSSGGLQEIMVKPSNNACVKATLNEDEGLEALMSVEKLKRGDVVLFATDIDGYLSSMNLYLRIDGKAGMVQGASVNTSWWSGRSHRLGFVYEKFEGGMLVYFANTVADFNAALAKLAKGEITAEDCEMVSNTNSSSVYYSYEKGRGDEMMVTSASYESLKAYKDTGMDCSKVYMHQSYGSPRSVIIFK